MRALNLQRPRDDATLALHRWTQARRHLESADLTREVLAELRRVRAELAALRLALEWAA
jgi:hypothetical protein